MRFRATRDAPVRSDAKLRIFRILVAGYAVSTFGNFLNLVAVNLYAYQLTGSALQTGLLMAVRLAVGVVAGPLAGRLVTRLDRRTVLVLSDVAQGLAMGSILATPSASHDTLLWVTAVTLGAGNTVFTVALRTSVPNLVGTDQRIRGNGLLVTGKSFAMVLGFASAGPMIAHLGYDAAFAANAVSFLVSALLIGWLPLSFQASRPAAVAAGQPANALAGWRGLRLLLAATPVLAGIVALRGTEAFGSASHNVAMPIFSHAADPADPAALLSLFWTAWAMGSLVMYRVIGRYLTRTGRSLEEPAFAIAVCLASVAFVAVFTGLPLPLLVVVALAAGFADGFAELVYHTRLQASPDEQRGLLFGLSATAETLGMAVGMLSSAVLVDMVAVLPVVGLFHGVVILSAGAFLLLHRARPQSAGPGAEPVVGDVRV